jgi:hypothetical protein
MALIPGMISSNSSSSPAKKQLFLSSPGRVRMVAEDQFRADARDLASRRRRLGVAEVAQELHGAFQALGGHWIVAALGFELEHVENLRARGHQPAERVS